MPKRGNESSLDYIVKRLRKLEEEVKRSRRGNSKNYTSSSSSSSSSSRSESPTSSRGSLHSKEVLEKSDDQETTVTQNPLTDTIDLELPSAIVNDTAQTLEPCHSADNVINCPSGQESTACEDLLDILGEDPSFTIEYGPEINKDLATRFSHIATSGLDKELRKVLLKKFLVPGNCTNIDAPLLNAEIKGLFAESVIKRDKAIESRQKKIAAGIAALAKVISDQLITKEKNCDLIKDLMNVGRIFCDVQNLESEARRSMALYSVKKELKEQLSSTKIDKYLFGSNLAETLKTAKAVSKATSELKPEAPKKPKFPATPSSSKSLNSKARTPAPRQPMGPRPRFQSPATQNALPRLNSSSAYNPRYAQTRRN